ncbi:Voltage-dependent T-type calcium channel subunit alpha-1H [Symbiodinium microadriaticum]|uniref:Voltage-dependent T-type calcium channel subunit alpha-1H n=1 Tax=Symbiodinium microadriaticum TaxID=2951 RepID=A0A1Q9EWD1_SYMMI|nr:Voltage-dependent T-type calcium channel subunit alpha-1H [Symbiodinium microadriaticum]
MCPLGACSQGVHPQKASKLDRGVLHACGIAGRGGVVVTIIVMAVIIAVASPTRKATFAIEQEPLEDAPHDDDGEAEPGPAPTGPESAYVPFGCHPSQKQGWPVGYAFFVFGPTNPVRPPPNLDPEQIRMFCLNILESEAMDSPLSDPSAPWTQVIRRGDQVSEPYASTGFAVIFALEMVIKLIAYGLFWCEHGYLKDGWNVLDGVVIITVLDILMEGRHPVVALLFLLIFALFATSMLSGRMYSCSETSGTVTLIRTRSLDSCA